MHIPSVIASAKPAARKNPLWASKTDWDQTLSRLTGSRRQRHPKLRQSPSLVVSMRLRSRTDRQKKVYGKPFELAAKLRADRLPLVMLQTWMARQDIQNEPRVNLFINSISPSDWADRFRILKSRGWTKEHIDHWIWILSGEDGDVRVARLVSTKKSIPTPIFLVSILSRSDARIYKAETLLSLMTFASTRHFRSDLKFSGETLALRNPKMVMTTSQFLLFLRRLGKHVRRIWPRSIVTLARFTAKYIEGMPSSANARSYHEKCSIFNTALQLFKRPAVIQPIVNMEYNWRAQKFLLAMSDNLEKPFIINKASYRAVREVMIGLKKSKTERAVALRYTKSWPPYRQDFDGLDAKRTAEDDYSRSVRAGVLMKEAGYPDDDYDKALDALGGMGADSPTIQTRGVLPRILKGEEEVENFSVRWAASIRATRNTQEAWKVFNEFRTQTGESPTAQVYGEMFIKLHAPLVQQESTVLPGDAREVFPVHNANYTEYELARLSPPSVSELYDRMINEGVKPEGQCLLTLITNANSLEEASRYLHDNGLDPIGIGALALFKEAPSDVLRRIPLLIFCSYIQLLCKLQPHRHGKEKVPLEDLYLVRHAINLCNLRLVPNTTEGSTFGTPWSIILRALARPRLCVMNGTQVDNDIQALSISMNVIQHVQVRTGVNAEMFLYLCRAAQKAATSRLGSHKTLLGGTGKGEDSSIFLPETISQSLKTLFSRLTKPIDTGNSIFRDFEVPIFAHNIEPAHLHTYMRTLAFLGDTKAMNELLGWMLRNKVYVDEEAERIGIRGQALVVKTLCAFQAFAGPLLTNDEEADIISHIEDTESIAGSWRWPTPEDVNNYVQSDRRGHSQQLQQKIMSRRFLASQQQGENTMGTASAGMDV
ncbi:uncharacterized protein GGS22DRAFT_158794 [Annulohypoxylon maeteangense]|uniref:uncharacterized protein n=1 Tax=Annulohypoxylon maeteangense TaxID=1927788 RepID=UPI0020089D70|nr:uncharacterized protein GGS22DRAFT_158794 [Annulohypoxylon maeteangense]KAI0886826.1 hypothetical protein GGS22DRAFT_158794 [Annulohypoxylon maeteangense]